MRQPVTGIPVAQPYPAAPPAQYQHVQPRRGFSTALCDCFSDVSLCCQTCLCPCITFGQIAEIVDRGSTSCGLSGALYGMLMAFGCWQGIYSSTYRSKLKAQYGLTPKDGCRDCWTHYWCGPCALCQEYRELQLRGYDVGLGWHANIERQSRRMVLSPTMPERMIR